MERFGIIADIHYGNSILDVEKLKKTLCYMNKHTDYLVLLGDIVNDGIYDNFDGFFQILTAYANNVKIVPVIGNHDMYKKCKLSVPNDGNFVRFFIDDINALTSERFELNYSFFAGDTKIICVDFNSRSRIDGFKADIKEEQLKWFENQIETAPKKCIIIAHQPLHHPLDRGWQSEILYGIPTLGLADFSVTEYNKICSILKKHSNKILFWLSGHGHKDKMNYDKNAGIYVEELASFFKQNRKVEIFL